MVEDSTETGPVPSSTLDPGLLTSVLADDSALVRKDRVEAASRRVEDGDLPDADALAAAVLDEFRVVLG